MNSYERVITALELGTPDRVPVLEWAINPDVARAINPELSVTEFMAKHLDAVMTGFGMDFEKWDRMKKAESYVITDHWGITRKFTGQDFLIPYEHPIKGPSDLLNYEPPDPSGDSRLANLKELVDEYKGEKAICLTNGTVFTYSWSLVGMERFFKYMKTKPEFVKDVMNMVSSYSNELARLALRSGADMIMCGDDLAYKKGLMISEKDFEAFLLPHYRRIVKTVHREGGYFVKHSDGDISDILGTFVDVGVDAINPIEPAAGMDIGRVKSDFGAQVCIIGNIDCGDLLSRGKPEEVDRTVRETIDKAGYGGGYILASSNEIHADVRPENFVKMLEAAKTYGKYE